MMEEKTIVLDKEAERLFQQFEGVEIGKKTALGKALIEEEKKLNACRGLLVELVNLLGVCFNNVHLMEDAKKGKAFLDEFMGVLHGLGPMPGHDRKILIRFRGLMTGTKASEKIDYVVIFGNILLDVGTAAAMVKNLKDSPADFQSRLTKGFQVFTEHGINNLFLQIPDKSPACSKAMQSALHTLSHYSQNVSTGSSALIDKTSPEASLPLIHDERDQPDLNLTMLARVNSVKPETMKALVHKVDSWMRSPNYGTSEEQFSSVYNAILGIKSLQKKMVPPPIEVNNIKWLLMDDEDEVVSKEKSDVAHIVASEHSDSPQEMARIMVSVYGDDYQQIDSQNLGERLRLASNLLTSIEGTDAGQPAMDEVLDNVEKRLDQASEDAYVSLEVEGGVIKAKTGEVETTIGKIHTKLKGMVSFFKARSAIKNKMKNMAERGISFDEQDYKIIAKDFGVSADEARKLIKLFKSCFDEQGSFLREAFGRNLPQFAKYRKKIFEFLWHYLKIMSRHEDRIALLNSLQILVPHLKQPQVILGALLADFSKDPTSITVSDRSALVLLTILISKYNKELRTDIEITPEEVLTVSKNLDTNMVAGASKLIDGNQEKFFRKARTIHRKLTEVLDSGQARKEPMLFRDIYLLEREVYIFLSLVGGNTARALIRGAANVYGDPKGEIYLLNDSERVVPALLQLLKIVSRGLGRVGERKDLSLLREIRTGEKGFLEAIGQTGHKEHVKRAMKCVEMSMQSIAAKK